MSDPAQNCEPPAEDFEAATDQAIAACAGDARKAVKALIVANEFLEGQVARLQATVSTGFARGRIEVPWGPKDR